METLKYFAKKFDIDLSQSSPIYLNIGRFKDLPRMFHELGFKVGAEVGVYQGDYSKWLLRMIPGLKLYGIDSWIPYKGYKDFGNNDIVDAYRRAKESVKGYDCELIKGWSNEVVNRFEDESLDFVFIDGNHAYEYVVEDIAKWSKKVRKGGVVYGHDYDDYSNSRKWAEMTVIPAVDGWCQAYKIDPYFILTKNKNKCWMYIKK
jgi:hypothetical protein